MGDALKQEREQLMSRLIEQCHSSDMTNKKLCLAEGIQYSDQNRSLFFIRCFKAYFFPSGLFYLLLLGFFYLL